MSLEEIDPITVEDESCNFCQIRDKMILCWNLLSKMLLVEEQRRRNTRRTILPAKFHKEDQSRRGVSSNGS